MVKAGLTGNIGSGKSLVAEIFRTLGAPVFHADLEAKNLYSLAHVKEQLGQVTGPGIFDEKGEVDRKALAKLLFGDKSLLSQVNSLIHPMVRQRFQDFSREHAQEPYVIYEAAILIESGYVNRVDRLIVVYAPEALRVKRVMQRDGVNEEEVMARVRNQASDEEKIKLADWVVHNDGSCLVIPQVLAIDQQLRDLSLRQKG